MTKMTTWDLVTPSQRRKNRSKGKTSPNQPVAVRLLLHRHLRQTLERRKLSHKVSRTISAHGSDDLSPRADGPTSGGWFGWFRKSDAPKPVKANLGKESSFYYDPDLGRWVNKAVGSSPARRKSSSDHFCRPMEVIQRLKLPLHRPVLRLHHLENHSRVRSRLLPQLHRLPGPPPLYLPMAAWHHHHQARHCPGSIRAHPAHHRAPVHLRACQLTRLPRQALRHLPELLVRLHPQGVPPLVGLQKPRSATPVPVM